MKINKLTLALSSLLSISQFASANSEQSYFQSLQNTTTNQIEERLHNLRQQAINNENIINENGKRYIVVNNTKYPLTHDNYIKFDIPSPFLDETAFRNVFDFIDNDWELSWYEGGVVIVNKHFGNYDYGNGCLIEYYPRGVIGNNGIQHVVTESASCAVNSFDTQLQHLSKGQIFNAESLGLDSLAISAIERFQDKLYITQDTSPGFISVVDINTFKVLTRIEGIETAKGFQAYQRINDISIHDGLLYVSSLSSNRVDIFDINNDHQQVLSLGSGTGSWSGSNGLVHAQAVIANHDYVFVADAMSRISVYRQQDLTTDNPQFAKRHGFLAFEGKYTHRKVQMHIIDQYLMVSTADRNYFIYDLAKLEQAIEQGIDLEPEKRVDNKVQKIDIADNVMTVTFNNRIEWHKTDEFVKNGFELLTPIKTLTSLNGKAVSTLKDVHFSNDELITATDNHITLNQVLTPQVEFTADTQLPTSTIEFDALMPASVTQVLTNDEAHEVLVNRELRSVNINSLVKTELFDDHTVKITNYAAKELRDISPELKLNGVNKWFSLGTIDRLPAYAQITLPLSAFAPDFRFNSANRDGVFDLSELFNSNVELKGLFEHRFSSQSDTFAQTLARLKPTWEIRFAANSTGKWRAMNGLYAREWLIIMTNFAHLVSSDEFKHVWFNFKDIMGYDMHGTAGAVSEPNGYFTANDYDHYYHSMLARDYVNVGITAMGGGLGGQGITGVDTWMFYTHYYGQWGIIAHEFGHGFDGKKTYHHNTSFANGGNGWQPLMTMLANYHIRKGDMPYMDEDINGFYKPENSQYHYVGVAQNKRKHRSADHMYLLDDYFMTFSSMPQGWFSHTPKMVLDSLNNQERMMLATLNVNGNAEYACRFIFNDGEKEAQLHGYVEALGKDVYQCVMGNDISYQLPNGEKVNVQSSINQFDWLSLYTPTLKGEQVKTTAEQALCTINASGFYGIGFVNNNNQCVQQPEVYWSNGNRWVFSSKWSDYKYR